MMILTTIRQNTFWESEITLFKRMLKYESNFARGHNLLAKAYYNDKKYKKAIDSSLRALGIMKGYQQKAKGTPAEPFYLGFIKGIHFDLAQYYQAEKMLNETLHHYHQALDIDSNDGVIYNNIATVYLSVGQVDQAFGYLKKGGSA